MSEGFDPSVVEEVAFKHALINAVRHGGKADPKAVMSKVMGEVPGLKKFARDVYRIVETVVSRVNAMPVEDQRRILAEKWPEALEERRRVEERRGIGALPELPGVEELGRVVTRFAPNPDFWLTLGNARPAILNYAYKLKYEQRVPTKFILRFEDTDPKVKRPMPEAYDAIREDLRWLGVRWDEEYVQSDRLEVYYEVARELIRRGGAYVVARGTACDPDEWKRLKAEGRPCPHRDADPSLNLELFDRMLRGDFGEGEAVLVVKTDLAHPDPSVRDWVAMRIVDTDRSPHPRVGSRYRVWPTYNFAVAVDDHLMGVTHVLRAQEHTVNTEKQRFVFMHMGWRQPHTIHFGRLRVLGGTLSKSRLRQLGVRPDDPSLPTIAGLRSRGILPEAIWEVILSVGIRPSDATIAMENLFAANRRLIEPVANRYMFVPDPVKLVIEGLDDSVAKVPNHPSYPERGYRELRVSRGEAIYVPRSDVKPGAVVRLMELVNVEVLEVSDNYARGRVHSYSLEEARRVKAPIIQWVPEHEAVEVVVRKPVAIGRTEAVVGVGERAVLNVDGYAQFMRFGFVKRVAGNEFVYVHD